MNELFSTNQLTGRTFNDLGELLTFYADAVLLLTTAPLSRQRRFVCRPLAQ